MRKKSFEATIEVLERHIERLEIMVEELMNKVYAQEDSAKMPIRFSKPVDVLEDRGEIPYGMEPEDSMAGTIQNIP